LTVKCYRALEAGARSVAEEPRTPPASVPADRWGLEELYRRHVALGVPMEEIRERIEAGIDRGLLLKAEDAPLRPPVCRGLRVRVFRAAFRSSPRMLRCLGRVRGVPAWDRETRRELARVWGIPTKPRIYREEGA
jgi:hypothetical protein